MKIINNADLQKYLDRHGFTLHPVALTTDGKLVAKAQADLTRQEIIGWGEEACPHQPRVMYKYPKRSCDKCWAELKGEIK
jgi:hypothetical protein